MHPSKLSPSEVLAKACTNVQSDHMLTDALKASITNELESCTDPSSTWRDLCATYAHLGSAKAVIIADTIADGGLGHVYYAPTFLRKLATVAGTTVERLIQVIEGLGGRSPDLTQSEAIEEWDAITDGIPIRQYSPVWLFVVQGDDPFRNDAIERLPCRLGLKFNTGDEFYAFLLPPKKIELKRPCVIDVTWDYQAYWEPHGYTKPLCATLTTLDTGFQEFLANAPLLSEAITITQLTADD